MATDPKRAPPPPSAPALPPHLPADAHALLLAIDEARESLLAKAPDAIRNLSFALFEAAIVAAFHGEDRVGKEMANRVLKWWAGQKKGYANETARFRTRHAVKHSKLPKSRASRGKSAYEEAAEQLHCSPSTAEKRTHRKPA